MSEIDGEYFKEGDVDCNQHELNVSIQVLVRVVISAELRHG